MIPWKTRLPKRRVARSAVALTLLTFILIAVALVALGVLVYIVVGPKASKTAQPATFSVQYTVEIKHLREDWRDLIGIGDVVTDADSLTTIGTVTDISYQNELCSSYDSRTGEVIYVEHPDYVTMRVTIETDSVTKTENGYLAGKRNSASAPLWRCVCLS